MAEKFEYKYSAPTKDEKKEINNIRSQYLPKNNVETKLDRLRHLDQKVKSLPTIVSLSLGTIGILVFGLGLTFVLEWDNFLIGVLVMLVGIIPISIAYFIHKVIYNKLKNKYGEEIIRLSDELLEEEQRA